MGRICKKLIGIVAFLLPVAISAQGGEVNDTVASVPAARMMASQTSQRPVDGVLLQGVVTDRDIVTRCLAADRSPQKTKVADVMTAQVLSVSPDMEVSAAAHLMGRQQVRRLPVVENGKVCGMVSLGDLAGHEESVIDAGDALSDISSNLSMRD